MTATINSIVRRYFRVGRCRPLRQQQFQLLARLAQQQFQAGNPVALFGYGAIQLLDRILLKRNQTFEFDQPGEQIV